MIALVDYGVGNLFSLKSSFGAIGENVEIVSDAEGLARADKIILPGVGAFEDAANKLRRSGLDHVLLDQAEAGKPLMGICLGMQLLFEESYEYGIHKGLGLIPGQVRPVAEVIPKEYKIPHIGWNGLHMQKDSPILQNISQGDCVYFVHSYYATGCEPFTIATTEYGAELTAAVQRENVFGCQFHPEKSGNVGLSILKAFAQL